MLFDSSQIIIDILRQLYSFIHGTNLSSYVPLNMNTKTVGSSSFISTKYLFITQPSLSEMWPK